MPAVSKISMHHAGLTISAWKTVCSWGRSEDPNCMNDVVAEGAGGTSLASRNDVAKPVPQIGGGAHNLVFIDMAVRRFRLGIT